MSTHFCARQKAPKTYLLWLRVTVGGGLPVGALTQAGLNQAVELGGLIRSRFLEQSRFIGREFDSSDFPAERNCSTRR